MVRQSTNAHFASEPARTMHIAAPKDCIHNLINIPTGSYLNLDFNPAGAEYSRQGTDLVFTFPEGSAVTLAGFFAVDSEHLPSFILPNGTQVTAKDLLIDIDIAPAAGPSPSEQNGSGVGEYNQDGGELIGGIDRLGDADSTYWKHGTNTLEALRQALGLRDGDDGFVVSPVTPPVGPGVTPPPPPLPSMYDARAVLYKTNAAASDTVRFRLLDGNNDPVNPSDPSVSCSVADDNGYFDLSTLFFNPDGTVSLSLSSVGLAALAAAGNANIYEYLTVTVNGHEYRMQLVVNQSGDFTSVAESAASNNGNSSGHEWHSETQGSTVGDRYGDQGDNEVWFEKSLGNDGAFKGAFTSHGGNDTISIENADIFGYGMSGGATLDTGSGRDTVNIKAGNFGMYAVQASEHNSINNAETVNIEGGTVAMMADGGSNSIANAENVTLSGGYGMYAWNGGKNEISDATVNVNGELYGLHADKGDNIIMAEDGTVTIHGALLGGICANDGGSNTVTGSGVSISSNDTAVRAYDDGSRNMIESKGDVSVAGHWYGLQACNKGENTIMAENGTVSISATGTTGIEAMFGGSNTVMGSEVSITGEQYGMLVHAADNTIIADGRVTISGSYSYGISASYGGSNTVMGSDISIIAGGSVGVSAGSGAKNMIESKGDVIVTGKGYGLSASDNGDNTIKAENGTVTITGSESAGLCAVGGFNTVTGSDISINSGYIALYSLNGGNNTVNASGNVALNATSNAGRAYGISGHGSITADSVTMSIKGDLSTIAMDGRGTVTASSVHMDAESNSGTSYGMYTGGNGQSNTVQSASGHALDLEINADYAMYSSGGNNVIKGGSLTGNQGDSVRITGDIYGVGNGRNSITTGAGDDVIIIDGAIRGAGTLYLDGGAGSDTLVLVASSLTEFIARYGAWLNSLDAASLKGIESIEFCGVSDLNDLSSALSTFLGYAGSNGISVSIQAVVSAAAMPVLDAGDVDPDHECDDSQDSLAFFGSEKNNGQEMGLGDDTAHLNGYAVNASITPGAGKDPLSLEEDVDIVCSSLSDGNGPDFSALIGSGINISDVFDHSYDSADGSDIASLLLGISSDNECPNKGASNGHEDFSGSDWNAIEDAITIGNTADDAYNNSLNEYILVQQIIGVTGAA